MSHLNKAVNMSFIKLLHPVKMFVNGTNDKNSNDYYSCKHVNCNEPSSEMSAELSTVNMTNEDS